VCVYVCVRVCVCVRVGVLGSELGENNAVFSKWNLSLAF